MTTLRVQAQGTIRTAATGGRLPSLPPRPRWHDLAACEPAWRDGRVEFVPSEREDASAGALANTYCNHCPVRAQCLATALKNKDYGIWAGTTREQREKLARTRTRTKCPVCQCEKLITVNEHDLCMACASSWKTERRATETEER